MKMIKSFLIAATALGVSTALHAQEQKVKAEIAKPVASTVPAPGSKPAVAPDVRVVTPSTLPGTENAVVATPNSTAENTKQATLPAIDQSPKPLPIATPVLSAPAPVVLKIKENQ